MDCEINVDTSLKFCQCIQIVVQKAGAMAQNLRKSTVNCDASFLVPPYVTHVHPIVECCSAAWGLGYITNLNLLQSAETLDQERERYGASKLFPETEGFGLIHCLWSTATS